jgi:hypothetical protein
LCVQVSEVAGDRELFRFTVTDVDRNVYRLAATSHDERGKWLSALGQAIKSAGTPRVSPPTSGFTTPPTPPPGEYDYVNHNTQIVISTIKPHTMSTDQLPR